MLLMAACFSLSIPVERAFARQPPQGATVAQASKVLDLTKFPQVGRIQDPGRASLAQLNYQAAGSTRKVYELLRSELTKRGFKELPGAYLSEQAASGTFECDGFKVSLSVFSGGKADQVNVSLIQHGNLDTAKLPVPTDVKPFFNGPVSSMYVTEASVEKIRQECRKLLLAQGWEAYGEAGPSLFFRQNAIRLTAFITVAPAQGNKTTLTYSTELMSVELPAAKGAINVQYSDSPAQLFLDHPGTMSEVVTIYRKLLAPARWQPTTENPFKIVHLPRNDLPQSSKRHADASNAHVRRENPSASHAPVRCGCCRAGSAGSGRNEEAESVQAHSRTAFGETGRHDSSRRRRR